MTERPRIMVDMSATLIHHGHVRLLKKASELGTVVVALTTDEEVPVSYTHLTLPTICSV